MVRIHCYLTFQPHKTNFLRILGVSLETRESLLNYLRREQTRDNAHIILSPLLYRDLVDLPMDKLTQDPSAIASSMVIEQ